MTGKSKEFLILTILLSLGACTLFGFLFWQIKSANERTSGLLNDIDLRSKEENTFKSIKSLVQEVAPLHTKLDTYFIQKEGVADFIGLLESEGSGVGVSVTIVSVEKADVPDSTELEAVRVTLNAVGPWEDAVRYLGILESLPYQIDISQSVLSRAPEGWHLGVSLSVLKEK